MTRMQERFSVLLAWSLVGFLSAAVAHAQVTTADLVGTVEGQLPRDRAGRRGDADQRGHGRGPHGHAPTPTATTSSRRCRPGTYTLTAEATGFSKVERTGVELQVNQRAQVDLDLDVGAVGETVVIEGTAPLLETPVVRAGQRDPGDSRCRTCRSTDATSCSSPR